MFYTISGHVELVTEAKQVSKKFWQRDLVLVINSEKEPAEGSVKIQFADEAMSQLDDLQIGDEVNVAFSIRGVPYLWQGETKHLVVLMGQVLQVITRQRPKKSKPIPSADAPKVIAAPFGAEPPF